MEAITFLIIFGIAGFVIWFLGHIIADIRDSETETIYISTSGRRVSNIHKRPAVHVNKDRHVRSTATPLAYQEKKEKIA